MENLMSYDFKKFKEQQKMEIIIEEKNVYGNVLYYPSCETAKLFCKLLGCKTLTTDKLTIIHEMGYLVGKKQTLDRQEWEKIMYKNSHKCWQ